MLQLHGEDLIIWPDDENGPTWCFACDLPMYSHMSDDYRRVCVEDSAYMQEYWKLVGEP